MNKLRGFKDAMDEAGIHIDKDRFHLCTKSISKSNDYLSFIYEKNVPFDAILTSDDSLAVGAVKFAYKHGIKVPDELEIVGYNNSVLANCTEPELSSIDSKVEQLSSNAVDLLMEVLGGGSVSNINTVTADLIKLPNNKILILGGKTMKQFMDKDFLLSTPTAQHYSMITQTRCQSLTITATSTLKKSLKTESLKTSHRYGSAATIINGVR